MLAPASAIRKEAVKAAAKATSVDEEVAAVADAVAAAKSVMFITGAGISRDSQIPTYRGLGGLYEEKNSTEDGMPIEMAMSGDTMMGNPEVTWKCLWRMGQTCAKAKPNPGHHAIAKLQHLFEQCDPPKKLFLLTQNVDNLHRRALSDVRRWESHEEHAHLLSSIRGADDVVAPQLDTRGLIEIHGNLFSFSCSYCGKTIDAKKQGSEEEEEEEHSPWWTSYPSSPPTATEHTYTLPPGIPPKCDCGGVFRPDIVLFGEPLVESKIDDLESALAEKPDVVISVGTTNVFPYVTEGILQAHFGGRLTVNINPTDDGMTEETKKDNVGGRLEPWESEPDGVGRYVHLHLKTGSTEALTALLDQVEGKLLGKKDRYLEGIVEEKNSFARFL